MNTQQLLGWMNDPASAGKDAGAQLDSLTQTFPYFQTAHLLLIKSLHNQNSFLYNNQLKIAAAYATNRKVLYELITKKATVNEVRGAEETVVVPVEEIQIPKEEEKIIPAAETEKPKAETEIIQPEFPKKRFVSNPDDWEAGMLRQLQLLHHWKTTPAEELEKLQKLKQAQAEKEKVVVPVIVPEPEVQKEIVAEEKPVVEIPVAETPTAADEINTLLYVLVEPDGAEDIAESTETIEEPAEEIAEENQNWEINIVGEETVAEKTPDELKKENEIAFALSEDPVQQEIILEAISSTIELEVDDVLPKPEEMIPVSQRTVPEIVKTEPEKEEKPVPATEIPAAPETAELSFSDWLKNLGKEKKTVAEPEPVKAGTKPVTSPQPEGNSLIDRFIKEQPRIKGQKNTFYSPVNMAKKSVQESDEFITETLARIYVKQGNISKAIRSYQKLSLKFPEKTAYFAALIEELKRSPK